MNKDLKKFFNYYVNSRDHHRKLDEGSVRYEIFKFLNDPTNSYGFTKERGSNFVEAEANSLVSELQLLIMTSEHVFDGIEYSSGKPEKFYYIPDNIIELYEPNWWNANRSWFLPLAVSFFISIIGGLLQTYLTDRVKINDTINVKIENEKFKVVTE